MIVNHELVHVVTLDQAAGADRIFRRLFSGKVMPVAEQPESILYFFLTTPRVAAPRWFHEGIAVFVDTWMAGGLGRAQSGYDEMVFRSMVRDGTRFYDPLGLAAEGTKIDFQVEVNSYLYGTRFMTWLAYQYSPEKVIEWVTRHPGSRAYYSSQFKLVFGTSLESAWADWIGLRADVSAGEPRGDSQVSDHPVEGPVAAGARVGLARVLRRRGRQDLRRPELPGRRRAHRRDFDDDRRRRSPRGHRRPADLPGRVARVGSVRQGALLHERQRPAPRSDEARPRQRQDDAPAEGPARRRSGDEPRGRHAVGHPAPERPRLDRADSAALHRLDPHRDAAVRHGRLRPRRVAGRQHDRGDVRRAHRQAERPPSEGGCAPQRRHDAVRRVRLRHRRARQFRVLSGRPVSVRQLVLHRARRTFSATRSPRRRSRRSPTPKPASCGRSRSATTS